ncbi:polysaccharide deacetylase family protein [Nostoc sp. CHAB 5824]|nr:polysaccharide deacetylase family protein [Nostoc sp. CHAB 5824]
MTLFLFQPRWLLSIIASIFPGVIYFAKTTQKIIALTIDDTPDPNTTPKLLEVLRHYQARATFFIISNKVRTNESIVLQIIEQGHELGNHLTKDEPSIKLSSEEFEANLIEAHHILTQFSVPHWLRPASGWYNHTMVKIAQKYGYTVALGSIFPLDTHIHSPWFASNHILLNTRPGSIVILHDDGERGERAALTLERVLPELARRGYRVVTLSELFSIVSELYNNTHAQ